MLEDPTLRKMKVLLTSSSRLPPWSTIVSQHSQEQVKQKTSFVESQYCPGGRIESSHRHLSQLYLRRGTSSVARGKSFQGDNMICGMTLSYPLGANSIPNRYRQFSLVAQGMFDWLQQEGPPFRRLRKDQVVELSQQPFIHTQAWQPCPISFVIKLSNQLILCRLDKINSLVKKGQPLKQWSCRGLGEVKARLEVIIIYITTFSLVPRNRGSGDYQLYQHLFSGA